METKVKNVTLANSWFDWFVSLMLAASIWLFLMFFHDWRGKAFSVFTAGKCFGISAVVIISMTLFMGFLARRSSRFAPWLYLRRPFGMTGVYFVIAHIGLSLLVLQQNFPWQYYLDHPLSTVCAILATLLFLGVLASSFPAAFRKLGANNWKKLQTASYLALLLSLIHFASLDKFPNWINWFKTFKPSVWLPPGTMPPFLFGVLVLLCALIERLSAYRRTVATAAMILILTPGFAAVSNPDHKLWLAQKFTRKIDSRKSLKLDLNERFDDGVTRWEEFYIDTGIDFALTENWIIGPRFRHIRARFRSDDEREENRLHLNVTWQNSQGMLKYSLRTRYEYRMFADGEIKHRMTERIKIARNLGRARSIYISDEIYYDIDIRQINLHEIHVGYECRLSSDTSLEVYYGHEIKKRNAEWSFRTHLIGLEFGYEY